MIIWVFRKHKAKNWPNFLKLQSISILASYFAAGILVVKKKNNIKENWTINYLWFSTEISNFKFILSAHFQDPRLCPLHTGSDTLLSISLLWLLYISTFFISTRMNFPPRKLSAMKMSVLSQKVKSVVRTYFKRRRKLGKELVHFILLVF